MFGKLLFPLLSRTAQAWEGDNQHCHRFVATSTRKQIGLIDPLAITVHAPMLWIASHLHEPGVPITRLGNGLG
jgi:hypothetical protein